MAYIKPHQFARMTPRQKMAASLSGLGLLKPMGVEASDPLVGRTTNFTTTPTLVPEETKPVTLTSGFVPTSTKLATMQQSMTLDPRTGPALLPSVGGDKPTYNPGVISTLTRIDSGSGSSASDAEAPPRYAEGSTPTTVDPSWFREQEETDGQPYVPPTTTSDPVREVRPATATPGGVAVKQLVPRTGMAAQLAAVPTPVKLGAVALGVYLLWRWAK